MWEKNVEVGKKKFSDKKKNGMFVGKKKSSFIFYIFFKKKKLYSYLTTNVKKKCGSGRKNFF